MVDYDNFDQNSRLSEFETTQNIVTWRWLSISDPAQRGVQIQTTSCLEHVGTF